LWAPVACTPNEAPHQQACSRCAHQALHVPPCAREQQSALHAQVTKVSTFAPAPHGAAAVSRRETRTTKTRGGGGGCVVRRALTRPPCCTADSTARSTAAPARFPHPRHCQPCRRCQWQPCLQRHRQAPRRAVPVAPCVGPRLSAQRRRRRRRRYCRPHPRGRWAGGGRRGRGRPSAAPPSRCRRGCG
jgi:hypothetical protein